MKKIDARTTHEAKPKLRDDLPGPSASPDQDAEVSLATHKLGAARGVIIAVGLSALLWLIIAYLAF